MARFPLPRPKLTQENTSRPSTGVGVAVMPPVEPVLIASMVPGGAAPAGVHPTSSPAPRQTWWAVEGDRFTDEPHFVKPHLRRRYPAPWRPEAVTA